MNNHSNPKAIGFPKKCIMALALLLVCDCTPRLAAQDSPKALAQFRFDGNAIDHSGGNSRLFLKGRPAFQNGALYHDGEYGKDGKENEPGCPIIHTPALNFQAFTVAIRFKAESIEPSDNIITGGRYLRWFSMRTGKSGFLSVTFDNQELEYNFPVTLETDRWYSIVCGVDLENMYVKTFVNGKRLSQHQLPEGLRQKMFAEKELRPVKNWCLANYSNGYVFHGLIDEFAVFDGEFADIIAADYHSDPALLDLITGVGKQPSLRRIDRLKSDLLSEGIEATFDGVMQYLDSRKPNVPSKQIIATLIRQLGDSRYAKRQSATIRLQNLDPPPLLELNQASRDSNPEVARRARMLLSGNFGDSDRPVDLLPLALEYLKVMPNPDAVPGLLEILTTCDDKENAIEIGSTIVSCAGPKNRQQIRNGFSHSNPWVRLAAVAAWSKITDKKTDQVLLSEYLDDPNELVQMAAISSLMSKQTSERKAALLNLQSSPSFTTRFIAQSLLEDTGTK